MLRTSIPASILLIFVAAAPLLAQYEYDVTRGAQIGLHAGVTSWNPDEIQGLDFEAETGFLFGGSFGWGMSDWLGLFARIDWSRISPEEVDPYTVNHVDVGIRAVPMLFGDVVRPYAEVFGAFRFLSFVEPNGFEVDASGPGFGGGLGLYVFVMPSVALNAGFAATLGNLEEVTFGGVPIEDVGATSGRLMFGLTWFP